MKSFWKIKIFSLKVWKIANAVVEKPGAFDSTPIPEWVHWQGEQFFSVCSCVHSWLCRKGAKLDITPKLKIRAKRRVRQGQGFGLAEDRTGDGGKCLVRFISP